MRARAPSATRDVREPAKWTRAAWRNWRGQGLCWSGQLRDVEQKPAPARGPASATSVTHKEGSSSASPANQRAGAARYAVKGCLL